MTASISDPVGDCVDTRFALLPYIDELRSAEGLSRRLGFAVRPRRIRVKPGQSAIVAWQREERGRLGEFEDWGFTAVMTSPDKLANARRRAARHGQELTVHEAADSLSVGDPCAAGATGAVLVSGGVLADPRIGKQVARTLDHLGGDLEIIGYNPARRLLLKHTPVDGVPELVRIAAESQVHLAEAAERWKRAELPSLPVEFVGGHDTATRSPWWGAGDLRNRPDPNIAEEVGVIIAELHRTAAAGHDGPADHVGRPVTEAGGPAESAATSAGEDGGAIGSPISQLETVSRSLVRLLPERETDIAGLLAELSRRLGASRELREIHGDLSPDQVLLANSECRIIDLDRTGYGPVGVDLGRWIAACRVDPELNGLERSFLDGYRCAGGEVGDLGAWTAWAMLVAALGPWRSCSATWRDETKRIVDLARSALDGNLTTTQTVRKPGETKRATARAPALHIPDAVTIDGQDRTVRRAWPAGDGRIAWEAVLPDFGIRVGYLDEHGVRVLDVDRDQKLPGLAGLLESGGTLVSHRPGRRAVVRLADGSFAKCVRDGKASDILAGQRRAAGFLRGFALPQVLRSDSSTVVLGAVPGIELHEPVELGTDWSRAWAETLDAWAHAEARLSPVAYSSSMPIHDAAAEVEVLHNWRERARPLLETAVSARAQTLHQAPPLHQTQTLLADLDALLAEIAAELDDGAASAREKSIGLIHRDLHDKQIMWDPIAGPGLLDVDTACLGERALDLGNLRAHARWRTAQGLWTPAESAVVIDEIARVASVTGIDPARVSAYERATLIRLACVYAFRPPWHDRIGWLLETARSLRD